MIREVQCDRVIDCEDAPGEARFPVIDPYDGCLFRCPYCFQWDDPEWNVDVIVKTNLPELIPQELRTWDKAEPVYIGSRGDPYGEIEREYQLTRRVLQELQKLGLICFLCTKSGSDLVLRDLDVFLQYGSKLTVCPGLSNLPELYRSRDQRHLPNVRIANSLFASGVNVRAFVTPVLPGITDVDTLMEALDPGIPVTVDKVRVSPQSRAARRLLEFIRASYPHLETQYSSIVASGVDPYFEELKRRHAHNSRVSLAFPDG